MKTRQDFKNLNEENLEKTIIHYSKYKAPNAMNSNSYPSLFC